MATPNAMLKRLSLENLKDLDGGRALEAFHDQLKRAVLDCLDRPGDKRARKIVLQFTALPVPVINGNTIDCDSVKGTFQCRCKLPDHETRTYDFGVQQSGDLIFNPDSPEDHRQMTMLEDGE
jgi:hypothetical protein